MSNTNLIPEYKLFQSVWGMLKSHLTEKRAYSFDDICNYAQKARDIAADYVADPLLGTFSGRLLRATLAYITATPDYRQHELESMTTVFNSSWQLFKRYYGIGKEMPGDWMAIHQDSKGLLTDDLSSAGKTFATELAVSILTYLDTKERAACKTEEKSI